MYEFTEQEQQKRLENQAEMMKKGVAQWVDEKVNQHLAGKPLFPDKEADKPSEEKGVLTGKTI